MRVILVASGCVSALFPSSASAALIGPRDISGTDVYTGAYGLGGCTYENVRLPQGTVRSPVSGTITRWRINIPTFLHDTFVNNGPVQLQVLRRTDDQPNVFNDQFRVVRQTPEQSVSPVGKQALNADLAIRKDDFIGVTGAADTEIGSGSDTSAYHLQWCPALAPGGPGEPADFPVSGDYLLYNATVVK